MSSQGSVGPGDTPPAKNPWASSASEARRSAKKKRKTSNSAEKKRINLYVKVWHVLPQTPPGPGIEKEGFLIGIDGFGEATMTRPFYRRNNAFHEDFLNQIKPVLHVFTMKGPNGEVLKGATGYTQKFLCKLVPDDQIPSDEPTLRAWINADFIPALRALPNGLWNNVVVSPHPTNFYTQVPVWSSVLNEYEIGHLLREEFVGPDNDYRTEGTFWKVLKNLYSFYAEGEVPNEIISEWGLRRNNLLPLDIAHFDWTEFDAEDAANGNGGNNAGAGKNAGAANNVAGGNVAGNANNAGAADPAK